jgi:hypothetical protein
MIAWESLAERETKWARFASDPQWLDARDVSEKNGAIVANITSSLLKPTSFSGLQ